MKASSKGGSHTSTSTRLNNQKERKINDSQLQKKPSSGSLQPLLQIPCMRMLLNANTPAAV
jgi:hypothetical protein